MDYRNSQKKNKTYTKKLDGKQDPKLPIFTVVMDNLGKSGFVWVTLEVSLELGVLQNRGLTWMAVSTQRKQGGGK